MMAIGFVYFVFLPSMFTTPAAGGLVRRFGFRTTLWAGLAVALAGLPLLIAPSLTPVAVGTDAGRRWDLLRRRRRRRALSAGLR